MSVPLVICRHVYGGFGRDEHQGVKIFNVSVVDETCRRVNAPAVIDLPDLSGPKLFGVALDSVSESVRL